MKSRGFSESHSIPYGKVRILGFLEAPLCNKQRVSARPRSVKQLAAKDQWCRPPVRDE
jgi:hypothetical protein